MREEKAGIDEIGREAEVNVCLYTLNLSAFEI